MSARARNGRGGFTLVEVLLAAGLLSILFLALLRLVDSSLTIWGRTDESRERLEMSGSALELLAGDLHAIEGGKRGDLLADWRLYDLDRDGIDAAPGQRLRLVRHRDAAGLQRLAQDPSGPRIETFERGLTEVCWVLMPGPADDPDARALGTLLRGERLVGDEDTLSFFDPGFFGAGGKAVPGSLNEVTGGVLWFELWFASQTSIVHDGWELGDELRDCASSWDAWDRARPDAEITVFNRPAVGMPRAKDVPLLPRRVRIALELERPRDLRFRTRLARSVGPEEGILTVRDGRRLPAAGAMILVGDEWMQVLSVDGERVSVQRGRRATPAREHPAEALVHHGWRTEREISVDMTREDWDL